MIIGLLLDDTLDKPDGVQQAVISIGEELRLRGHEVHYLVSETHRTDLEYVHSVAKYFSIKFNGNSVRTPMPTRKGAIQKILQDIKFDVLHVQMPYSPLFSGRVLKLSSPNVRKIGTFHILPFNVFATWGTKLLGVYLHQNKKLLDTVFAVSEPAQDFMKRSFGLSGKVLANPVNYSFYSQFSPKENTKKQIVFVGRFEQRKGVKELVEACSQLPTTLLNAIDITMCGKGPLLDDMKKLANQKGLNIHFPGFVTDEQKAQYLANADIAVFPSIRGESFGIVLTEAMSAGSGITIGGNNPGYASVLAAWPETLFNPKDTQAFAQKIEQFLTDDTARTMIGQKQHQVAKQYDIRVVVDELEKEYKNS